MKRLSLILALAGIAVSACGGNDDEIDLGPDAEGTGPACDPIEQSGCEAGEKCAQIIESEEPFSATEDCVPEGSAQVNESCALVGDPADGEGYDDCAAGLSCTNGRCVPICDAEATGGCDAVDGLCVRVGDFFDDNVGICTERCDPVEQDCQQPDDGDNGNGNGNGDDEGDGDDRPVACYFNTEHSEGTCLRTAADAVEREQGVECLGVHESGPPYFINGCAEGHGCLFFELQRDVAECSFFCEPTGEFDGAPCGADGGPGDEDYECRYLNGWLEWAFATSMNVPTDLGLCVPTDREWLPPCAEEPEGPGCSENYNPATGLRVQPPSWQIQPAMQSLDLP